MRGTRARCSYNVLSIFLRRVDCVYPVKPSAHAPGKATMLKRPAPARPIYQALTHLERYHSLICKMFLRAILIASEHVLTVNARPLRRWMSQTDNRRRASSALPSPLLNININTAESGSAMSSEILATFEHED